MFSTVLNHIWQSTLFAGSVAILCYLLRRESASVRYWLWWAASVKFLVPFSLLVALGRRIGSNELPVVLPEGWSVAVDRIAQPLATASSTSAVILVVSSIWAAGSTAFLIRWISRALQLRTMLHRAEQQPDALFSRGRRIDVFHIDERIEPCIFGIFVSALLLPKNLEKQLSSAELEAVVAHELCHARRRDNLTAAIHKLVETLFWFYPLVWWIGARLIDERERACDQAVVSLGHDRETYATSILKVCEFYAASPLSCAAGVSGRDLKQRVKQIMRSQVTMKLRTAGKALLTTFAAVSIGSPILAGLFMQSAAIAQQEQLLQIVKIAPFYPERAAARGLAGYVIVEFTVTPQGSVDDVVVVESSSSLFEEEAVQSVQKYKYAPRTQGDQAVAVPGVRAEIRFEPEPGGCEPRDVSTVCVSLEAEL